MLTSYFILRVLTHVYFMNADDITGTWVNREISSISSSIKCVRYKIKTQQPRNKAADEEVNRLCGSTGDKFTSW